MARRSLCTNLPVPSTVKSVDCATTIAALPEPNCPTSTLDAASSQSGALAASAIGTRPEHTSATAASHQNRRRRLLPAQNDDFLIMLGNLIEKALGAQIFVHIRELHLLQYEGPGAGDGFLALHAGVGEAPE